MTDDDLIASAIERRKNKHYAQSREILRSLLLTSSVKGPIYLHIAWSYDNEGKEQQAFDFYQQAINQPLSAEDKFEAIFGLACTARCLGKLTVAEKCFEQLFTNYPERSEIIPFYALCAMALQKTTLANSLLMSLVISHPPTEAIANYQQTLKGY